MGEGRHITLFIGYISRLSRDLTDNGRGSQNQQAASAWIKVRYEYTMYNSISQTSVSPKYENNLSEVCNAYFPPIYIILGKSHMVEQPH